MKKILLTGASGFIGKNLLESYLSEKYEITAPTHAQVNWADTKAVDEFFKKREFDAVWHFAIKPFHRNASDFTDLFLTNMYFFENLVRHKDKYGKFINAGSGAVYGLGNDISGAVETDLYKQMGTDELSFFKYVVSKRIDSLPNFINLNIFGIFGKYEDYAIRFISNAICKTLFNLPITLRQNRRFSYLDIADLPPIIEYFTQNKVKHHSYNIVPDTPVQLLEIAKAVQKISENPVEIQLGKQGYGLDYFGDNSRLKKEMSSVCFTPFDISLKNLYDYYKNIKGQIQIEKLLIDK